MLENLGWQDVPAARGSAIVMQRRFRPALALVIVLLALAGLSTATASPSRAAATAKPCWERVIDDWLDNGTIDGTYKPSCYRAALKHLPEDLRDYTGVGDAIAAALQSSLRGQNRTGGSVQGGGSVGASHSGPGAESGTNSGGPAGTQRTLQVAPDRSYYRRAIDDLGPTSADSLPIPLIVLAGLGTVLLLTASGLAARKRLGSRGDSGGNANGS